MMPQRYFWLIIPAVFLIFAIIFFNQILESVAGFLIVSEPPEPADAAIVLSGEISERVDYAVKLFHQGLAKYLVLSGNTPGFTISQMEQLALGAGVPKNKIILESDSNSTYENALGCRQIFFKNGFKKGLLVTSSYHSRRAGWIFKKIFKNDKIKIITCAAPDSWFQKEKWWQKSGHVLILKREYERLGWYFFYYGVLNRIGK